MIPFRSLLFWLHLTAGVLAGLVVFVMSATGVALTYEKQILEWADSNFRSAPRAEGTKRLTPSELVGAARRFRPEFEASGVTLRAAADAPASVSAGREQLYLDAYTGQMLGEPNPGGTRAFMTAMRSWHRWLSVEGPSRTTARAVTGWSNMLFLLLVMSGMYLWLPRVWNRTSVAAVAFFKRSYGTSKARDFNWHNVIGIWCAVPLFIVVLSAVPISFPWASDLVYRAVGEEPPARGGEGGRGREGSAGPAAGGGAERREGAAGEAAQGVRGGREQRIAREGAPGGRGERPEPARYDGWDVAAAQVAASVPGWRTLTIRREGREQVAVAIDRGTGGQPQLRSTATFDREGRLVATETFSDQSLGRRIRSVMRFAHTGEVLGLTGQTVAGLVSAGAMVMVWTGLALSWRRFCAWITRTSRARISSPVVVASTPSVAQRATTVVAEESGS
jgi:uncharacterized iron-regulated membrane protein